MFEEADTIFYQDNSRSQTHLPSYVGGRTIMATTGELMWCAGRYNVPPINDVDTLIRTRKLVY